MMYRLFETVEGKSKSDGRFVADAERLADLFDQVMELKQQPFQIIDDTGETVVNGRKDYLDLMAK